MLDLQAGVDLEERDRRPAGIGTDHELDGAGALVADVAGQCHRTVAQSSPDLGGDPGRRRLLDDLLIATLDGALAFAQVHDVAVLVAEHLHLDVASAFEVRLDEHRTVAERGERLTRCCGDRIIEFVGAPNDPHATTPAAGGRLDQRRIGHVFAVGDAAVDDLDHRRRRNTSLERRSLRRHLVAEQRHLLGCRPDPDQACLDRRLSERSVLGRNPYPGWIASAPVAIAAAMIASPRRYDSAGVAPPSATATSTESTCSALASGSE